jgi:glyoxylase-like metal-dependent hydrolase (beta-lactamase superfamily II)
MKQRRITPNILQLTEARFVNAYLVQEDDGLTLVDTGLGRGAASILAAADAIGQPIVCIALTHAHSDHAGAVDALETLLGDAVTLYLGDPDARICDGEQVISGKRRGSWAKLESKPDVRLHGGERIGSLEVVASPGHTPGHMAFLDVRDRTLLAGDTFTTYWRTEIPNRLLQPFPLASMGTQDRPGVVAAAKALAALEPRALAVGHGPFVREPARAMQDAIRRAERSRPQAA